MKKISNTDSPCSSFRLVLVSKKTIIDVICLAHNSQVAEGRNESLEVRQDEPVILVTFGQMGLFIQN